MPDTMITIASGTLVDYTVSLTLGVIDPTFRWSDSLGSVTDRRHERNIPIDEVDAYMAANSVDKKTALCAIVKTDLATKAQIPVEQFGVSVTPFASANESPAP